MAAEKLDIAPFDAILLDAPCSATGTIRRHPDVTWTKGEDDLRKLTALQTRLLDKAAETAEAGRPPSLSAPVRWRPTRASKQAEAFLDAASGFRTRTDRACRGWRVRPNGSPPRAICAPCRSISTATESLSRRARRVLRSAICPQSILTKTAAGYPILTKRRAELHRLRRMRQINRSDTFVSWGPDRWRLYGLALREVGRAMRESLSWGFSRLRMSSSSPTRLLFAPQDLRTADPTIATEIYSGFFAFAGRSITTSGRSPFSFVLPSRAWARGALWIRLAAPSARRRHRSGASQCPLAGGRVRFVPPWRPAHRAPITQIVARRLTPSSANRRSSSRAPITPSTQRFLRIVGNLVRDLERHAAGRAPCLNSSSRPPSRFAMRAFAARGSKRRCAVRPGFSPGNWIGQILADGGHASRNPRVLVDLLFDLLRRCGRCSPAAKSTLPRPCCERSTGCCRWCGFSHGDGTLSHFNGMGVTAADHLATLLPMTTCAASQFTMRRSPAMNGWRRGALSWWPMWAPRLQPPCRSTPEPVAFRSNFRAARQRIVVNCGTPRIANNTILQASRSTVAHSTASINDVSSSHPSALKGHAARPPGRPLAPRPDRPVVVSRPHARDGGARRARPCADPQRQP